MSLKILVADDDSANREMLRALLRRWQYEVTVVNDGDEAWKALSEPEGELPEMAILDWMMPGLTGIDLCQRIREYLPTRGVYVMLLTALNDKEHLITGLKAGADDYLSKPFHFEEMKARIGVGVRVLQLQKELTARVRELEDAMGQIRMLEGLIPICSYCKKIRDDHNFWHRVEEYISRKADARFTHGVCPECLGNVKRELEQRQVGLRFIPKNETPKLDPPKPEPPKAAEEPPKQDPPQNEPPKVDEEPPEPESPDGAVN